MNGSLPEPWLRGAIQNVHPLQAQVLYTFQQAMEDLTKFTDGLTSEQMWSRPFELAPVGFHLRHIAGSIDRLLTYAHGNELSGAQMSELKTEMEAGASRQELLDNLQASFSAAEVAVRSFTPETFTTERKVGRKQLPTTVAGLLIHVAEHTQRHVGQAITTAKVVRHTSQSATR
jgi:hypothetical protein